VCVFFMRLTRNFFFKRICLHILFITYMSVHTRGDSHIYNQKIPFVTNMRTHTRTNMHTFKLKQGTRGDENQDPTGFECVELFI